MDITRRGISSSRGYRSDVLSKIDFVNREKWILTTSSSSHGSIRGGGDDDDIIYHHHQAYVDGNSVTDIIRNIQAQT